MHRNIMILISVLILAGIVGMACSRSTGVRPIVKYHHDDLHQVSCWILNNGVGVAGISCLPDSQIINAGQLP